MFIIKLLANFQGARLYAIHRKSIYNLRTVEAFTPPQVELITDAFLQNNQLNWIASDPDVSGVTSH